MPVISMKHHNGKVRWISVFPFNTLEAARSYVAKSVDSFSIVKAGANLYWVLTPQDAEWAVECGYKEVK